MVIGNNVSSQCFIEYDSDLSGFRVNNRREGFIYIIRAVGTNRIKIGYSRNPEKRFLEIQSPQMPFDLELIHKEWFIDAYALEQHLHKIFKTFRKKGEWFEIPIKVNKSTNIHYLFVDIADKYKYRASLLNPKPIESSLIQIGRDSFYQNIVKPEIRKCLESIVNESGANKVEALFDDLTNTLLDSIRSGLIDCWRDMTKPHPFDDRSKKLLFCLNTTIDQLISTIRYKDNHGFHGENLTGTDYLSFSVGVISGILNAYNYCLDAPEDFQ